MCSLRTNQFRMFADPERALTLAKAVVKAKIANQRTLLMRCLRSRSVGRNQRPPTASHGTRQ